MKETVFSITIFLGVIAICAVLFNQVLNMAYALAQ